MAKQIITPAMVELRAAITEAEGISAKSDFTKRDEARINVLLAKIAALRNSHAAPAPAILVNAGSKRCFPAAAPAQCCGTQASTARFELRSRPD